jgi:arsenate reductase
MDQTRGLLYFRVMITVYHYPQCSTCKKALKWLDARGIEHKRVHIVDSPPSKKVLQTLLKETGLPLKKLFNTSGQVYREGGYKEKLETMTDKEAIDELASHGKLIKRPLITGDGVHLVGFQEADCQAAFP